MVTCMDTDGRHEFYMFWKEILLEEREKGNSKRVKEIEDMLKKYELPIPQ